MFIGSSVEGKFVAETIQEDLDYEVASTVWHRAWAQEALGRRKLLDGNSCIMTEVGEPAADVLLDRLQRGEAAELPYELVRRALARITGA